MRFLNAKDESEIAMMIGIARAATQIREREYENLAVDIANRLAKIWGG